MDKAEFLKACPKYADWRSPDLIQIDFKLLFPGKEDALSGKWENFKEKISLYYESNIHSPSCRELLKTSTKAENIDSSDFIFTILLPSVLPEYLSSIKNIKEQDKKYFLYRNL
ncbi:uncharacterized protein LOC108027571 isoform X3 [Drosophila biarmipes]|uniref:uncharacterized protein LOC108027571 isoform X3 n=1 Tax=Drosophila biarmipes TaxID=125945 RepID=UPI0007E5D39D|nr:uncharacterized protein LOC108027571 isoform X3 [Drosophila biarmipes]XP_050745686.1 uncharacterized protein LOC108027571 isoform X3 [Drosophila biarmipes]